MHLNEIAIMDYIDFFFFGVLMKVFLLPQSCLQEEWWDQIHNEWALILQPCAHNKRWWCRGCCFCLH